MSHTLKAMNKHTNSYLPYQTSKPKQVTLEEGHVSLEHKLIRNYKSQKVMHNKSQTVKVKKLYIKSLNESITTEDIYEHF